MKKSPTLCLSAQGGFNIVFVLFIVDFAAAVRTKHLFAAVQNAEKMPAKRASNLYKHNRKRRNNEYNTAYAQTSSKLSLFIIPTLTKTAPSKNMIDDTQSQNFSFFIFHHRLAFAFTC